MFQINFPKSVSQETAHDVRLLTMTDEHKSAIIHAMAESIASPKTYCAIDTSCQLDGLWLGIKASLLDIDSRLHYTLSTGFETIAKVSNQIPAPLLKELEMPVKCYEVVDCYTKMLDAYRRELTTHLESAILDLQMQIQEMERYGFEYAPEYNMYKLTLGGQEILSLSTNLDDSDALAPHFTFHIYSRYWRGIGRPFIHIEKVLTPLRAVVRLLSGDFLSPERVDLASIQMALPRQLLDLLVRDSR